MVLLTEGIKKTEQVSATDHHQLLTKKLPVTDQLMSMELKETNMEESKEVNQLNGNL